ncbi:helix-turn-helix transcriptional regulator [Roseomonas hellenica]|uniref:Helix-turn-helix transcriptional regulator n=1 Tax=Plastoroseomonas hellenica TaxID=2687306 RepID=A0ABS5F7X3_9PROT|nr:helix-turn-helix transcriptional regulator [Plastoroseomonas hellenica]MBR0668642.1 helix-turn-helix transcriptional regulator [Plastoroseomonas hellenica]
MAVLSQLTLEKLHAAALDPGLWPEALTEVADAVGAQGAMVHAMAPDPRDSVLHVGRLDPDCDRLYMQQYQINPMSMLLMRRRPGEILPTMSQCRQELRRTAFKADILTPQRIEEITNLLYGGWEDVLTGGFGFCLNAKGAETTAGHLAKVAEAAPQLTLALDLARHLNGTARRNWSAMLETMDAAALLADAGGRVILANRYAERLLRRGHWLRVHAGRLQASRAADEAKLAAAIRTTVLAPVTQRRRSRLSLRAVGNEPPCLAVIAAAPAIPVAEFGLPRPAALLILRDPSPRTDPALLRSLFGMTESEARIAAHIAGGLSLGAAAQRERIAHTTARTHLQAAFGKVGVHSQSALASLLARLPESD